MAYNTTIYIRGRHSLSLPLTVALLGCDSLGKKVILDVEMGELGITAGLQDRVVQVKKDR